MVLGKLRKQFVVTSYLSTYLLLLTSLLSANSRIRLEPFSIIELAVATKKHCHLYSFRALMSLAIK